MAWIQIHQQLKDHRKVLAAADELDIEPAHMLGLLISFWLWAIDNAPDGSLAGISDRMIARAAQWDKDPEEFVAALTSASLLDVTEDGVLEIHDWSEYTGKLIEQRENEKNRSRARRAAAKSNDRRTTAGQSADVSKSDQKKTAGRVDQTRVDQSRPENKGDTPITPAAEKQPSAQERRFAEFWTAYPKKVGKKAAQKAWEKAKPDAELSEKIMQAVATAKTSEQWLREGGRFIPNPSTWINQGRWDDEPLPPAGSGSYQQRPGGNCGKPDTMDVLAGIKKGGGAMAEGKQNLQNAAIIAKLFGVTDRRIQQLAKEGIIPAAQKRPYMFDLLPTVQSYIRYLSDKANGREAKSADAAQVEMEKLRAEADMKRSKADMAAMQLKELEGKMHRSEDVEAVTNDLVYTVRSMIMALPGRLAMDVVQVASANEASALIRAECYKILNELANYNYDPAVYQRRVRDREGWSDVIVAADEADD